MSSGTGQPKALLLIGRDEQSDCPAVRQVQSLLVEQGYHVAPCTLKDWLRSDATPAPGRLALVIAAGGDGCVREAAAVAQRAGALLAVLPLGTANDLARTLQLPMDAGRAAALPHSGRRRTIDLGRCNGRLFCNVASLGLSTKVVQRLSRERKRRWGPLAYAREVVDAFRTYRGFGVRLEMDGRTAVFRALQVGVASGESQGGGNRVSPEARIDDGWLRVYVVEPQPFPRLLMMALSLKLGAHDLWEGAHFFTARRVRIETKRRQAINVDGDLLEHTPADFDILPSAIDVLVPAEAAAGGSPNERRDDMGDGQGGEQAKGPGGGLLRSDAEVALGELAEALAKAADVHARGAERLSGSPAGKVLQELAQRRRGHVEEVLSTAQREGEGSSEPDPDRRTAAGLVEEVRTALSPSAAEATLANSREAEDAVGNALSAARSLDQPEAVARQLASLTEEAEAVRRCIAEATV